MLKKRKGKRLLKGGKKNTRKKVLLLNDSILNKKLCKGCTFCCEYINIGIAPPKTEEDFDFILWYLLHEKIYVWFDKKGNWYVRIMNKCRPLKNKMCAIYSKRPMLCREYDQKKCEKDNFTKDEAKAFHTPAELISYMKSKKKKFFGFYE